MAPSMQTSGGAARRPGRPSSGEADSASSCWSIPTDTVRNMTDEIGLDDATSPGGLVGRRVLSRVIDDGILTALSIVMVVIVGRIWPSVESGYNTAAVGSPAFSGANPLVATVLAGLLSTVLFLIYMGSASRWEGVTIGRAVTRLKVVDRAGGPARPSLLLGRELMRVALVSLCLGLAYFVALTIVEATRTLSPDRFGDDLALIVGTVTGLLPIAVVVAGWVGAALIDPAGSAPHDRLSRTRVVRQARG